jgi:hypothetical protein
MKEFLVKKTILILIVLIGFCAISEAQFGINIRYVNPSLSNEQYSVNIKSGYGIGADYWFRLKNKRIEFMPEVGYEKYNIEDIADTEMSNIYLMLKTNFYLLNFNEDCNCPTFSKEGNTITKGFYLFLAPEIKIFTSKTSDVKESDTVIGGIIGAGLDIGISDRLTITPNIGYELTSGIDDFEYSTIQFGLRMGFRFSDGKSKFRR